MHKLPNAKSCNSPRVLTTYRSLRPVPRTSPRAPSCAGSPLLRVPRFTRDPVGPSHTHPRGSCSASPPVASSFLGGHLSSTAGPQVRGAVARTSSPTGLEANLLLCMCSPSSRLPGKSFQLPSRSLGPGPPTGPAAQEGDPHTAGPRGGERAARRESEGSLPGLPPPR